MLGDTAGTAKRQKAGKNIPLTGNEYRLVYPLGVVAPLVRAAEGAAPVGRGRRAETKLMRSGTLAALERMLRRDG